MEIESGRPEFSLSLMSENFSVSKWEKKKFPSGFPCYNLLDYL